MKTLKKVIKWGIISVFALVFISVALSISQSNSRKKKSAPSVADEVVEQTHVEPIDIQVESQIVKKVGKKYRYFFSINNKDTRDFVGKLHIVGKTGSGTRVISKYIDYADKPLRSGLSQSVYAEASSAPAPMIGEYGVSTFTFSATIGKDEVAKGEGLIIDKFEDLSN